MLLFGLIIGAILIVNLVKSDYNSQHLELANKLKKSHADALTRAKTGINTYATIVSSVRAYIENSEKLPQDVEIQKYLNDVLKEIDYTDSIVISLLDTNHNFVYVISPRQIDPQNLAGKNLSQFRSKKELETLDSLMEVDKLNLLKPLNLVEGWAAFPFMFPVENQNIKMGYIAANLDIKYLLNVVDEFENKEVLHRIKVYKGYDFSREAVFDGSPIFNKVQDERFYKNLNLKEQDFKKTKFKLYGLELELGTAFIKKTSLNHFVATLTIAWYLILILLIGVVLNQYGKILTLKKNVLQKNRLVNNKNKKLKEQVEKIQTLIREVHHRVKNNMQIISSLLNLQSHELKDEAAIQAIDNSKRRIESMALVHKKLYEVDNLDQVNTKLYIEELFRLVSRSMNLNAEVGITLDIPETHTFNADQMIPIGLIFNELITNSYKHAFSSLEKKPEIKVNLSLGKEGLILTYADNGQGFEANILENSQGLGLELIKVLTQQLEAELKYANQELSEFTFSFKN